MEKKLKFVHSKCTKNEVVWWSDLNNFRMKFMGSYGAVVDYYFPEYNLPEIYGEISDLCFVHGNEDDLWDGKRCVVRNQVFRYVNSGEMDENGNEKWDGCPVERAVIHLKDGGVILKIGTTANGNSIIVMK